LMDRGLQLAKQEYAGVKRFGITLLIVDETKTVSVIPIGNPVASIVGIRVQDLTEMKWYDVFPEGQQAYCRPGPMHIIFGAVNVGSVDGNLKGMLLDEYESTIIPETAKECFVGNLVYWETDLIMPARTYALTMKVGH